DGQSVERRVAEGQRLRVALHQPHVAGEAAPCLGEHLGALVEAADGAAGHPDELRRDRSGPRGDVEDDVPGTDVEPGDEEAAPARVLPEGKEARVPIVGRSERREQIDRMTVASRELDHEAESILARCRWTTTCVE